MLARLLPITVLLSDPIYLKRAIICGMKIAKLQVQSKVNFNWKINGPK